MLHHALPSYRLNASPQTIFTMLHDPLKNEFRWRQEASGSLQGATGDLTVSCRPVEGLYVASGTLHLSRILGLEIVDAVELGPKPLATPEQPPQVILRQDTILAQYAPTAERPVECDARWRVQPQGVFDLQISTLTPGKWDGLAVQTLSVLPPGDVVVLDDVSPGIVLCRPAGLQVSYAEFCHPHDGIGLLQTAGEGGTTQIRFRLFGHDLEKGVILRGRLRGVLIPRVVDVAAVRAAYDQFLAEPPHLTL
jgi:hypothetical protein